MPEVVITHETSREEALRLFREATRNFDPAETVNEILDDLRALEEKYGMSTVEFYARYQAGLMGDEAEVIRWASLFEAFVHLVREHAREIAAAFEQE